MYDPFKTRSADRRFVQLHDHFAVGPPQKADSMAGRRGFSHGPQYRTHAVQQISYSITASARASSEKGTVRPSALASRIFSRRNISAPKVSNLSSRMGSSVP